MKELQDDHGARDAKHSLHPATPMSCVKVIGEADGFENGETVVVNDCSERGA